MAMANINYLLVLFVALVSQCTSGDINFIGKNNHEFDLLIFTQRWPVTTCLTWMEESHKHTCSLPSPKEIWTIHGIWPTKFGTIGPAFCNSSATFNPDELKPFQSQLEQFWLNIEAETPKDSLWKHEWLKHGTCASVLPELENENKYFGQGLSWLQQYSMSALLQKSNILPDADYKFADFNNAIKNALNVNPSIHCVFDPIHNAIFLSEIRICFNKSLSLTDCDGVTQEIDNNKFITNCDLAKPILYLSTVPKYLTSANDEKNNDKSGWRFPFVNFYKLIQLIQWLTI